MGRATTSRTPSHLGTPGAGRRFHVDPHRGIRVRRARHQTRPGGDHPGHPELSGRRPSRISTRAASSASALRSARRHPRRQDHPEGRDASSLRRKSCSARSSARRPAMSATRALKVPHGESGKVIDVRGSTGRTSATTPAGGQPARAGLCRPEAQDQRGRQAGRSPRQQGRHLQDPAGRGHAVPPTERRSTSSSTRSAFRLV